MSRDARRRSRELADARPAPASALDVEAVADALVADLFQNGSGLEGERLAIMAGGIDHGGWSRAGFRDRVIKILKGRT